MLNPALIAVLGLLLFPRGCFSPGSDPLSAPKFPANNGISQRIALYEAWFGHPRHISVGYNSHDSGAIRRQIRLAKAMGISAFVVDWYGSREPFIDQSYAIVQTTAQEEHFQIAMMYDETKDPNGSTEQAILDLKAFHDRYLVESSSGRTAYLTYDGHPLIFVFPTSGHTDWAQVRTAIRKWEPSPLLIDENLPGQDADAFDGFYPWINPGKAGWAPDGSNWGESYLTEFYSTMQSHHPDKMIVGGVWASFDDSKAGWGLNRHISARCGQTLSDTNHLLQQNFPLHAPPPFVMVETWNDHEEGSAVEDGIPSCPVSGSAQASPHSSN
jgi:hypothetical protein